jgi:hypothetical protein
VSFPARTGVPLGVGTAAVVLSAVVLALAVASPAYAAGITSVTPNPAPANAVISVVADCDGTVAEAAEVRYSHHRSDNTTVNFHTNLIIFTNNQSIADSYDTTGIAPPGVLEGDYYLVTVTCDNPDTTNDPVFNSGAIPIILGGTDPVDPPDEAPENDGVSFRTGVESSSAATSAAAQPMLVGLVLALGGAVLVAHERSRRRPSGR